MSIVTLTFDLWPPKSIGFILSSWLTCLPSLTKICNGLVSIVFTKSSHARTEPHRYYIPTATCCAGIKSLFWQLFYSKFHKLILKWYAFRNIKVCLWNTEYAPGGKKVQKPIFSLKVKVKVTRSLTLVSFERVSLVEYACQVLSLYLLRFKSYSEG